MIRIRDPETVYIARGHIENGSFTGRWHFSFDEYYDPDFIQFGNLRVFNDDELSSGAVWPLHQHQEIEVVTYCANGEFKHADERGEGGVLRKGWVQHTTVGKGMQHSEINNSEKNPMRFIQMWFVPEISGLSPSVEQKQAEKDDRKNTLLPLVSNREEGALAIRSDAAVYAAFLEKGKKIVHSLDPKRGYYLYLFEGGPVAVDGKSVREGGAAMITNEATLEVFAEKDAELILVDAGKY